MYVGLYVCKCVCVCVCVGGGVVCVCMDVTAAENFVEYIIWTFSQLL